MQWKSDGDLTRHRAPAERLNLRRTWPNRRKTKRRPKRPPCRKYHYVDVLLFLFARSLRGQRFECEPQELAHAGILLSREALQRRALIRGDADRDLPVRIAGRFAAIEIESGDCSTNDLACGGETMSFTAGLDSRDKRFGKSKR